MTNAEFLAALEACNWDDPAERNKLVTSTYTNMKFNEKVIEKELKNELGAYNYFGSFFGSEVWQDGQGMDEVREFYADPHVPFSFSYFIQKMEICDPNLANECIRDRCKVPQGGRGTLPGMQWFEWGFETPRDCIRNIRSLRDFMYWSKKIIRGRDKIDEQVKNMFYTMAGIKLSGHKIVLQGERNTAGLLQLVNSSNPRNPLRGGLYNYMEEKFPQPTNLNNLLPLTTDMLEQLARYWSYEGSPYKVATGPRGEAIFELWTPDDMFRNEFLKNPDRYKQILSTMPNQLFPGWTLQPGQREIIGNYAPKVMPWLPRFAPTTDGKIVPVDNKIGIDIEVGQEFVNSVQFENAPIGMAVIANGKMGTIMSRPTLSTSGAGFPIQPISMDSGWRIRNDYDKECNPDLNMPYSQRDYEMGFRLDDPNAATAILFRRHVFNQAPVNECDLAPMFNIEETPVDCSLTTVGCSTNKRRENNSIVDPMNVKYVNCTTAVCSNPDSVGPYLYIISIDRKANQVGFDSLGCECGGPVALFVYDEEGVFDRQINGVLVDTSNAFPFAKYIVRTTEALADGECIKGIACGDDTPLQGYAIDVWDTEDGDVTFILSSSITCDTVGDDVQVRFYDENDQVLGTVAGTIVTFNPETLRYTISSTNPNFARDMYEGAVNWGLSCAEAPNASSSSSGD